MVRTAHIHPKGSPDGHHLAVSVNWGPCGECPDESPTVLGSMLGALIFGNTHIVPF